VRHHTDSQPGDFLGKSSTARAAPPVARAPPPPHTPPPYPPPRLPWRGESATHGTPGPTVLLPPRPCSAFLSGANCPSAPARASLRPPPSALSAIATTRPPRAASPASLAWRACPAPAGTRPPVAARSPPPSSPVPKRLRVLDGSRQGRPAPAGGRPCRRASTSSGSVM
jgi:hypothetical protein